MKLRNPFKKSKVHVSKVISQNSKSERTTYDRTFDSSQVTNAASDMIIGNFSARRIQPDIPFLKMREYYETIGRVQNVVDSMVDNVINRQWFFDDTTDAGLGGAYDKELKALEDWKKNKIDTTDMLSQIIRNWLIFGVAIISPNDWVLLQMESLVAKRRDNFGNTISYIQQINGRDHFVDSNNFFEIPFINLDRKPWGTSLFASVMNVNWVDIDGEFPHAAVEWYRQNVQDYGRIQHRYGSPRVIYGLEEDEVNQETIDNEIAPMVEGMKPGDRAIINGKLTIVSEAVDGQSRFVEYGKKVQEEVDTGLQSSANRLITEPSAMADAREAGDKDDDRILGLMQKVKLFMDKVVIPAVTGDKEGHIEFKWGSVDSFNLVFPEALERALDKGVLNPEQGRRILEEQFHWKIPESLEQEDPTIPENPNVPKKPEEPTQTQSMEIQLIEKKNSLLEKIKKEIDSLE